MSDLIKALQIFLRYGDPSWPTHCEHDVLIICGIDPDAVSDKHKSELDELGFFVSARHEGFISYRYGSA